MFCLSFKIACNVGSYTQLRTASASRRMSSRKAAQAESKISEAKDTHRKPLLPSLRVAEVNGSLFLEQSI